MTGLCTRLLALVSAWAIGGAALAQDRSETSNGRLPAPAAREVDCGWVYPVQSHHAEIDGLRIDLPANDRLIVNGRLLSKNAPLEGRGAVPWQDSANKAEVAWWTPDFIVVQTRRTDCIDYNYSQIYVLDLQGSLVASRRVWTHSRAGLFTEYGGADRPLVYWSDYFCRRRRGDMIDVYVLRRGARAFVREDRRWDAICSGAPDPNVYGTLEFNPMRPQSSQGGAALAASNAPVSGREDCGWVYPLQSLHAEIAGLRIDLPANDRLVVNGAAVAESNGLFFEGRGPLPWADSGNGARVARAGDFVLVETRRSDCIDYNFRRIYVLDAEGSLVASSRVWTEHHLDGFLLEGETIVYWSEHFCRNRRDGMIDVQALRPQTRAFVRETRRWSAMCTQSALSRLIAGRVRFTPMRPQSPPAAVR